MHSLVRLAVAGALLGLGAVAAPARAQNPSFNLINRAPVPIRELFFTPAGDPNWGRNRLQGRSIPAGASFAARRRLDGNCIFDIRVVFQDGRTEDRRDINTCQIEDIAFGVGGAVAGARKAADDPSFKLVNRGAAPINELFVVPAGQGRGEGWGQNRLAGGPLQGRTDQVIRAGERGQCSYDLKVVLASGKSMEKHGTDLCRITELPVP